MYPPRLYKEKQTGPFRPRLKRREFVYVMEENTNSKPAGEMDVILATDIEGNFFFKAKSCLVIVFHFLFCRGS
jgi:hypothetical protein